MPEANVFKTYLNFLAPFYTSWASDSAQFCHISANERRFLLLSCLKNRHICSRHTRSQGTQAWFIFLIVITREHLAHCFSSSSWGSLRLQDPTRSHMVFISWPPASPHTPTHTQGPHPLFTDSNHCHLYLFHRSKWGIKSQHSALHISSSKKWLPAGPMCSLGLYSPSCLFRPSQLTKHFHIMNLTDPYPWLKEGYILLFTW